MEDATKTQGQAPKPAETKQEQRRRSSMEHAKKMEDEFNRICNGDS